MNTVLPQTWLTYDCNQWFCRKLGLNGLLHQFINISWWVSRLSPAALQFTLCRENQCDITLACPVVLICHWNYLIWILAEIFQQEIWNIFISTLQILTRHVLASSRSLTNWTESVTGVYTVQWECTHVHHYSQYCTLHADGRLGWNQILWQNPACLSTPASMSRACFFYEKLIATLYG